MQAVCGWLERRIPGCGARSWRPLFHIVPLLCLLALLGGCARQQPRLITEYLPSAPDDYVTSGAISGYMPPFEPINEPIERYNRTMHGFNHQLMLWFVRPFEVGYRFVMPRPVRQRIVKMGHNLAWPVRLFGNLLQGKVKGAGIDTGRFLINTTVGIVGLFDPAARLGLRPQDEDFGQAFGDWGMGPGFYFVLPFKGPSTGRDAFGGLFDMALNPATYVPGLGVFFSLNEMSFSIDSYLRLNKTEMDPYVMIRDVWSVDRLRQVRDYDRLTTQPVNVPTLRAVFLQATDPTFVQLGREHRVRIAATGRKLAYSVWMQPEPAPVIYILPGTGGHRLSGGTVALAEIAWERGFSTVTVSNVMNPEFMESAATHPVPGYPPTDARNVYNALNAIHHDLQRRYPGRVTASGALGLSLGGLHALTVTDIADDFPAGNLRLERTVAVSPPVNLLHALEKIDQYYHTPLLWPEDERAERMSDTLMLAAKLGQGDLQPSTDLPFTHEEAQYLIGLYFRMLLRDVIYTSQRRMDLGILENNLGRMKRQPVYQEIMRYSYVDYLNRLVLPYYQQVVQINLPVEEFLASADLRQHEAFLRSDDRTHVVINDDDFLLRPEDIEWLRATLGERLLVLEQGGHLGNLYQESVQTRIMQPLEELLRPAAPPPVLLPPAPAGY